jgi:peptidoglycan/xylan/chitin deacetylase (PgdA/CDA1 family)
MPVDFIYRRLKRGGFMKFIEWFDKRGPRYLQQRAMRLLERYQLSPSRAIQRIDNCLDGLMDLGCSPTFPTPGIVLERYPDFLRRLQEAGAEIAVHGYQHVDLKTYPVNEACQQLLNAVRIFNNNGIKVHGFRCPYLGSSEELLDALPKGLFGYSSNKAIFWNTLNLKDSIPVNNIFDTLRNLYGAEPSLNTINLPQNRPNMLEIPVTMPDDLELLDGLNFTPGEVANTWGQILRQTHQRGELFTLMFHPELASLCEQPFYEVLNEAKLLLPRVWVARLCDISEWWAEKGDFRMEVTPSLVGLRLDFICSSRATILLKGIKVNGDSEAWDTSYQRLLSDTLEVPASPRPFIGVSGKISEKVNSFLLNQGYILDLTEQAHDCSIYLDEVILESISSEVQLIHYIEGCAGPLIRYWRWPNGAKSALSITGDLDALSLLDYLTRIYKT